MLHYIYTGGFKEMPLIKELECSQRIADQIINTTHDYEYKEYVTGSWIETYRVNKGFFKTTETLISTYDLNKHERESYEALYSEICEWYQLEYKISTSKTKKSYIVSSDPQYNCTESIKVFTTTKTIDDVNERLKDYCREFHEKIKDYPIVDTFTEEIAKISSTSILRICICDNFISINNDGWDDNVSICLHFKDFGYEPLRNNKEKCGLFTAIMDKLAEKSTVESKWCYMLSWPVHRGDEHFRLKLSHPKQEPELKKW